MSCFVKVTSIRYQHTSVFSGPVLFQVPHVLSLILQRPTKSRFSYLSKQNNYFYKQISFETFYAQNIQTHS